MMSYLISKEKLWKYGIHQIDSCSITGWKYIGEINNYPNIEKIFLKTDSDAWLDEFKICIIQTVNNAIILVSPNCPEYYFGTTDIQDKIKSVCEEIISEDKEKLGDRFLEKFYKNFDKSLSKPINSGNQSVSKKITWVNYDDFTYEWDKWQPLTSYRTGWNNIYHPVISSSSHT